MQPVSHESVLTPAEPQVNAHQWKEATAAAAAAAAAMPKDHGVQLMYAGQLADTGKVDEGLALAKAQLNGTPDDRDVEEAAGRFGQRIAALDAQAVIDLTCYRQESAQQLVEALSGRTTPDAGTATTRGGESHYSVCDG